MAPAHRESAPNNFVDPPGYTTGTLGELGGYKKVGSGLQAVCLWFDQPDKLDKAVAEFFAN